MPIILKSDENIRNEVLCYLKNQRNINPAYKVIDIGGTGNPWCDEFVDAYVDMNRQDVTKRVILGDINSAKVWDEIACEKWDFSICTHTLEDIRRPDFVCQKLIEISKAGFIAVPNKHTELSCIESPFYVGYCHHRWIFTVSENNILRMIAKFPIVNYFSCTNFLCHWLGSVQLFAKLQRKFRLIPGGGSLCWLNKAKISKPSNNFELGFIWESDFPFEIINNDFAGMNYLELADLYRIELSNGI